MDIFSQLSGDTFDVSLKYSLIIYIFQVFIWMGYGYGKNM